MTGRRPSRGAGGDPWRGGRPGARDGHTARGHAAGGPADQARHAEVEELSVQQVSGRRPARVGLGPAIASVALVGLLAAGFGFLGGRPEASSAPSGAAIAPTSFPTISFPSRTPAVTPWSACGPDPAELPTITLQSNGVPFPGEVELADDGQIPLPTPGSSNASPSDGVRGPEAEVRPDVITELWIEGGTCALQWSIELIDPVEHVGFVVDAVSNPGADPAFAAQNRFNVSLGMGEHRTIGHDVQFGGVFALRTNVVRAFWRLRILGLDRPSPSIVISNGSGSAPVVVEGCDVTLTLGNGWTEGPTTPCNANLSAPIEGWEQVRVGGIMSLLFDGWTTSTVVVTCGQLDELTFIEEPAPGCWRERPDGTLFLVPDRLGRWTLAMSACADQDGSNAANRICGTWYSNVEVVKEQTSLPTLVVRGA